jgi:SNF2 family DNA or RNA helicase
MEKLCDAVDKLSSATTSEQLLTVSTAALLVGGQGRVLKPYQLDGANWIGNVLARTSGAGCILGDEMGLGKTIQSVTVLALLKQQLGVTKGGGKAAPVASPAFSESGDDTAAADQADTDSGSGSGGSKFLVIAPLSVQCSLRF